MHPTIDQIFEKADTNKDGSLSKAELEEHLKHIHHGPRPPAEKPGDKAAGKPDNKAAEKPGDKAAGKPDDKAAEKPESKPAEKADEKPADKPDAKASDKPEEKKAEGASA